MSSLRENIAKLLAEKTLAEIILDELNNVEIKDENYIDYFDAVDVLEIYEEDIRRRRMRINLKINFCFWQKYNERKIDKPITV